MNITNKHGLPEPIVQAIRRDPYDKGGADYSATELIQPVRVVMLKRRHKEELTQDAIDMFWSLWGQAAHVILERSVGTGGVAERRLHATILGKKISAALDYMEDGTIIDYKTQSVWSAVFGGRTEEWTQQLNIQAWLCRQNGIPVERCQIMALYRDWHESKVGDGKYPDAPAKLIEIPLWDEQEQADWIRGRLLAFAAAETDLPACTKEDTWEKWDKKARKVKRPRCERYCGAADFCDQWQAFKELTKGDT